MRKLIALLLLLCPLLCLAGSPVSLYEFSSKRPNLPYIDDTGAIQSLLTSGAGGTVTLPVSTYYTSASLIVPANTNFQLSGSFIITSQGTGAAVKLNDGAEIQGGTLQGQWAYTTPGSPSGYSGVQLLGSNTTIFNMRILGYSGYGIVCFFAANNISITHNEITKTGYIGFYYGAEATTSIGNFSYNIVDRSMIAPSAVIESGVIIRGSTSSGFITSVWTISHNTISMPLNPTNITAECMEVRFMNNSTISNNTFFQGSIGASLVFDNLITLTSNRLTNQSQENIEAAACTNIASNHDYASGAASQGNILIDGYTAIKPLQHSSNIILSFDTVRSPSISAVHCYIGTRNVHINNCNFSAGTYGIDMQQSDTLSIINTVINGHGIVGRIGIYFDTSPGNTTISNGAIDSCTYAVKAFNTGVNALVDNIVGTNVNLSGTSTQFTSFFTNGAHYGTNVRFVTGFFTFPAIAGVIYGVANFSPGASSNLPITYTSGNTAIATIVSGFIHITGTGTVSITATTSDTSASQPLVVSKKALTVTAENKVKTYGSVNPSLTITYSPFAYSENNSVFTTQPTISTTAVTGSPVGTYPVTASGIIAANYTLTYVAGVLTVVTTGNYRPIFRKRVRY